VEDVVGICEKQAGFGLRLERISIIPMLPGRVTDVERELDAVGVASGAGLEICAPPQSGTSGTDRVPALPMMIV
jgi:hypothetical protein